MLLFFLFEVHSGKSYWQRSIRTPLFYLQFFMTSRLFPGCALAVLMTVVLAFSASAQTDPIKFGKIDSKDFEAQNFAADSGAEAVMLCDYGRSTIDFQDGHFRVVFDRTTRIKVLKKSGYDWANVHIPLYKNNTKSEKVTSLKGMTYNLVNGEIVREKLESTGIFSEQIDANHSVRKFTLPNVKEGSVIEYSYSVSSDFVSDFQDWQFQHTIPTRWSEYRANIPEYFDYKMLMQGYEPLAVSNHEEVTGQLNVRWSSQIVAGMNGYRQSGGSEVLTPRVTNHQWAMKNLPAFREEPYMTTMQDYLARLDFELMGTKFPNEPYQDLLGSWQKITTVLLESDDFGGQLRRAGFLKAEVAAIVAKYPEPAERVNAIVDLAKRSIVYNGNDRLTSLEGIRKAYDQHRGSSADVNLLLIALLKEAKFSATPLILSTRDHGRVDVNTPLPNRFNYVLAHVVLPNKQEILLDATDALAASDLLPERCLNTQGRLLTENSDEGRWLTITSPQRYTHFQTAQLVLDERGGMSGKVHHEYTGYRGLEARTKLHEEGEKKYVEHAFLKSNDSWEISKFTFQHKDVPSKPLAIDVEVKAVGNEAPASTIYLTPMRYFGEEHNPFRVQERLYPVDFGAAHDETQMLSFTIPAGYEVEEMPKSVLVSLPDNGGRFQYNISPTASGLQIMSRISFNKPSYSAEEYAELREFYNHIVAKHAEQIVLKKKS